MTEDERRKLEYVAGVVEDTAAALRGETVFDEDDKEWSAEYLMQAAAFIRKQISTLASIKPPFGDIVQVDSED